VGTWSRCYTNCVNGATTAALVTACAALLSSVLALLKLRADRRTWTTRLREQREQGIAEWQVQFLRDLVQRRQDLYPPVFEALGVVVDLRDPVARSFSDESPEALLDSAREIRAHLYGSAGLVMSMESRNWLHLARVEALKWAKGNGSHDDLVDSFYYARRQLREDIQIADLKDVQTALNSISEERRAEPRSRTASPPSRPNSSRLASAPVAADLGPVEPIPTPPTPAVEGPADRPD